MTLGFKGLMPIFCDQYRPCEAVVDGLTEFLVQTHGRRSVGGQQDISPAFWSGRDALCFVPPYFFGGRLFCTNAHGILLMIGAIFVKFCQLILMKVIKTVGTRGVLRLNAPNSILPGAPPQAPLGELTALPRPSCI